MMAAKTLGKQTACVLWAAGIIGVLVVGVMLGRLTSSEDTSETRSELGASSPVGEPTRSLASELPYPSEVEAAARRGVAEPAGAAPAGTAAAPESAPILVSSLPEDLGVQGGRFLTRLHALHQRFGGKAPNADDPSYPEYVQGLQEVTRELIPLSLSIEEFRRSQPDSQAVARFQGQLLQETLGIDPVRAQVMEQDLARIHGRVRELGLDVPPAEQSPEAHAAWQEARSTIAREFNGWMSLKLTAEEFQRYGELFGNDFVYGVRFGNTAAVTP